MPALRAEARKILESSFFFIKLLKVAKALRLVGEERNALVVFLVAVSRFMRAPLNLFVKGESSSGKNFLVDIMLRFINPAEVRTLTSSSDRSWNNLGDRLKHTVVYIKERNELSGPIHPTRLLVSEGKLVHFVSVRRKGGFKVEERITEGPIASISTTTQDRVEVDDESRHLSIWIDLSAAQTKRIALAALEREFPTENREVGSESEIWYAVQTLLSERASWPYETPKWFGSVVHCLGSDDVRIRRYFPAFLRACKVVCLVRSFSEDPANPTEMRRLRIRFSDLAITLLIFDSVFAESLYRGESEEIETRQHLERLVSQRNGQPVPLSEFCRDRSVSRDRGYALLRKAARARTIYRANRPAKGNSKLYLPSPPRRFLPDPREIFRGLPAGPTRVEFVHPLTGEWVIYDRKKKPD